MKIACPTTPTNATSAASAPRASKLSLACVRFVWLFGALVLGCGGSSSQASPAVASNPSPENESAPASPVDVTECPRTAEDLALALRAIASHDVPPPTAEDLISESEWTEDLRAWNRLQSARLRSVETDGASAAGVSGRHRVWVHALRARTAALENGPFEAQVGAEGGSFQAGSREDGESLTIRIIEEDGCVRIDDR